MSKVIEQDPKQLMGAKYERVSLGLKPSGPIHLGTALTFMNGMIALESNKSTTLDVMIMDLDHDFQRGKAYHSFFTLPDSKGCHRLMKQHTAQETRETIEEMASYFGVDSSRINIANFSDTVSHPQFQAYMRYLFLSTEGRTILKSTVMDDRKGPTGKLIAPNCEECGYSATKPPKISMEDGTATTNCLNDRCDVDQYSVSIFKPGAVNLFYLVDPIRDLVPNNQGKTVDLHVFGGDYGLPWGKPVPETGREPSKAERVLALMAHLSTETPDIYVGPILLSDGMKIGKSLQNGQTMQSIRANVPNWVSELYSLVVNNPGKIIDLHKAPNAFYKP